MDYCKAKGVLAMLQGMLLQYEDTLALQEQELQKLVDQAFVFPEEWFGLAAALMHRGQASSGHYFAFIKDQSVWRKYDDRAVLPVSEEQVIDQASGVGDSGAYYLIYRRVNREPLLDK